MGESGPRKLNALDATLLVMGGILGVGIFFTPADVAAQLPHPGAFLGVWAIGGVVALCGAATFAELGGTFPRSGGWFEFLREIFGPFAAFLFAWVILGVVASGAISLIAGFGAARLLGALPWFAEVTPLATYWTAVLIILGLTALMLAGAKAGAGVQNAIMVAKLGAVLMLVYGGFVAFAPLPDAAPEAAAAAAAVAVDPPPLWRGLIGAFLPVFFAFGGWQHLCYIANDVRDPQRTLPRAILLGVGAIIVVYLLVNGTYLRVLGTEGIATAPDFATETARRALGARGELILGAGMAISAIGVCLVNILVTPGIFVGMARNGLFFRSFGRLHPRTGAPVLALLVQAALALAYLTWSHAEALGLASPPADPDAFHMTSEHLTGSVVFAEWFFHALIAYGLLRLRRRRPELPRPYRSFLWPLAPVTYLAVALVVLVGNLATGAPERTLLGCAILAAGALVYVPWRRAARGS